MEKLSNFEVIIGEDGTPSFGFVLTRVFSRVFRNNPIREGSIYPIIYYGVNTQGDRLITRLYLKEVTMFILEGEKTIDGMIRPYKEVIRFETSEEDRESIKRELSKYIVF